MIEKAEREIKELSQKTLFQKAEIKKRYFERSQERSIRLKSHLIGTFEHFLNQSLSTTLLQGKEKVMGVKNNLIKELKLNLFNLIKTKIKNNYADYIKYLLKSIEKVKKTIYKPQEIEILFNSNDYDYFIKNFDKIIDLFKNPVEINKDQREFIGGFKVSLTGGTISYDYTIDNLIDKASSFIQMEIAKIVDDTEIKEIEKDFEDFINIQKEKITEYLQFYEQIQF